MVPKICNSKLENLGGCNLQRPALIKAGTDCQDMRATTRSGSWHASRMAKEAGMDRAICIE